MDCSDWVEPNTTTFDQKKKLRCVHPNGVRALKKLTIARAPEALCLHIRRLVATEKGFVKLNSHIDFPVTLDLAPYCSFDCSIPNEKSFDKTTVRSTKSLNLPGLSSAPWRESPIKPLGRSMLESSIVKSYIVGGDNSYLHPKTKTDFDFVRGDVDNPHKQLPLSSTSENSASLEYELVSVVEHHGNHSGGHYTVFRRNTDQNPNQWFHISDDVARPVSCDEVLRSCAYMLYYERL